MKLVIQRVKNASVSSGTKNVSISKGLLVLTAVGKDDTAADIGYMVDKTVNLRVFSDSAGKMNLSVKDIKGEIMAVPQFTLYGDCRSGRRPGFEMSANREKGKEFFDAYVAGLVEQGMRVVSGFFGEEMSVGLVNDGPVTLIVER